MYTAKLSLPSPATAEVLEAVIEAVVVANTLWYLAEYAAGREPPCCASCGGVRYVPDRPASSTTIPCAPVVFAVQRASCHAAAAISAGRERAMALLAGIDPQTAKALHRVALDRSQHPTDRAAKYWHAVYMGPEGPNDVTEEMDR